MSEPTSAPSEPPPPGAPSPGRAWPIAFAVVVVLLIAAVAFILLRDDGSDDTATTGTTTGTVATATSTTGATGSPSSSDSEPVELVCAPDELLDAVDPGVVATGASVTAYGCAPATRGDADDAYAWAEVAAPGVEPLAVFYAGRALDAGTSPVPVEWRTLGYGTSVVCEDFIPVASCDMLPGARRAGEPAAEPSTSSTASADRLYRAECTAADLRAAVDPGVLADGAEVVTYACTPSSLDGVDDAYAYARFEAPDVGSIDVLFQTTALVEPGSPTVVDWQLVNYGSAIACDDSFPPAACDQLTGVPRA